MVIKEGECQKRSKPADPTVLLIWQSLGNMVIDAEQEGMGRCYSSGGLGEN